MPSHETKNLFRWIGSGLSVVAVVFVIDKLKNYGDQIDFTAFATLAFPILGLAVVYGLANSLLAFAWKELLTYFGEHISAPLAIRIYGRSQLAKYVPGNFFHFFGRQALGLEAGLSGWPLAKSAVWEVGILIFAGSTFITLILPYFIKGFPVSLAFLFFSIVVLTLTWVSNHWFSKRIAKAMGWHLVFLILTGTIFLTVLLLIAPAEISSGPVLVFICASYVVSWLVGFVTPGAPAGAGIREVALFALLRPFFSEPDLLSAVIFGRIITLGGDVLFYLSSLGINSESAKK